MNKKPNWAGLFLSKPPLPPPRGFATLNLLAATPALQRPLSSLPPWVSPPRPSVVHGLYQIIKIANSQSKPSSSWTT